jgi:hypothetical protein
VLVGGGGEMKGIATAADCSAGGRGCCGDVVVDSDGVGAWSRQGLGVEREERLGIYGGARLGQGVRVSGALA